jgi:hypothetical protein
LQSLSVAFPGWLQFTQDVVSDLNLAGFSPAHSGQRALSDGERRGRWHAYQTAIDPQVVPVRKTLLDWLLFRRVSKVVGGSSGKISSGRFRQRKKPSVCVMKAGSNSKSSWSPRCKRASAARPAKFGAELAATYAARSTNEIVGALRNLREQLTRERTARQVPFERQARILSAVEALSAQSDRVATDIDLLTAAGSSKASRNT